ncbi:hypothetical protein [Pedobacter heparinus]|uniref:hypothetical protein n=1 Tax=Pedobacter heparinus TaxID=984 RepID=UPI00292F5962|nr:hypothetical protein [Pedobacter heparinus]
MKVNYETMQLTFGQKFVLLRQIADRSESETALLLKKSLDSYLKLESDFLYPTDALLRRTAKLYGLSYQELLEFGEYD